MLKFTLKFSSVAVALLAAWLVSVQAGELRLFDLDGQELLTGTRALDRLQKARFVLVGEHHDRADHHRAQLQVIEALHESGRKVAVGLEMFRRDSQADLDRWTAGDIDEDRFKAVYLDNWNFDWALYRPIFDYARTQKIPMAGLNVPGTITAQVAYHGFNSLNAEQKGALEGITCDVTAEYRNFVRRAYGAHGHGRMEFGRFCEAQLVWDSAMAINAINFLEQRPETVMVILAGSGHARKLGIPAQLEKRTSWPFAVLLPQSDGIFDAAHISVQDADFIIMRQ